MTKPPLVADPVYAEAYVVAFEHVRYMRARGATCADICRSVGVTPPRLGIHETTARLARIWMMELRPAEMADAA